MKIEIQTHERAFLLKDGRPVQYLTPGTHELWSLFNTLRVEKVSTQNLLAELDEQRLKLVPADDLLVLSVAEHERALITRRGKAAWKWSEWRITKSRIRGTFAPGTIARSASEKISIMATAGRSGRS